MTKILFVCLGNICRSPMAEYIMKDLVKKEGVAGEFFIASAASCSDEIGNPVYPPAKKKLAQHGIDCSEKRARLLTREDYDSFDLLIGMEESNLRRMRNICNGDPEAKMHLLLDYTDRPGGIADPWYTDDFDTAWNDIELGCRGLLAFLRRNKD